MLVTYLTKVTLKNLNITSCFRNRVLLHEWIDVSRKKNIRWKSKSERRHCFRNILIERYRPFHDKWSQKKCRTIIQKKQKQKKALITQGLVNALQYTPSNAPQPNTLKVHHILLPKNAKIVVSMLKCRQPWPVMHNAKVKNFVSR